MPISCHLQKLGKKKCYQLNCTVKNLLSVSNQACYHRQQFGFRGPLTDVFDHCGIELWFPQLEEPPIDLVGLV